MAEVKCGTCSFRVANKCRILGAAVAVDADCSLSQAQRKDAHYQLKRIIGTPGGSRVVDVVSVSACSGGAHIRIDYSIDGGPTRTRTIDRDAVVTALRDQEPDEQFISAVATTLTMANPATATAALAAITGGVFYIGPD